MDLMFPWQPAEEVRKDREEEKIKETQEDKLEGEVAKRETKEVQTSELKAELASQKTAKKTKTVLAKVTLLDGTEYSCDLEVRQGLSRVLSMGRMKALCSVGGMAQCPCFLWHRVPIGQFIDWPLNTVTTVQKSHGVRFEQHC